MIEYLLIVFSSDILAEEACHSVSALSYCMEAEEKAVVYSGDTEPCPHVAALTKGANQLIHNSPFPIYSMSPTT